MSRRIDKAFRDESVRLALSSAQPYAKTARDLGIQEASLYTWISKPKDEAQKGGKILCERTEIKFQFVRKNQGMHKIGILCETLGVSRSVYYAWISRSKSNRAIENERLLDCIGKSHKNSRMTYGYL